jgi:hypothetical protein
MAVNKNVKSRRIKVLFITSSRDDLDILFANHAITTKLIVIRKIKNKRSKRANRRPTSINMRNREIIKIIIFLILSFSIPFFDF